MKKLLVGCLAIVVLGAILFAVGGYILYRAASPVIQDARNYLQTLSELGALDRGIANKTAYAAPASRELTEEQVQRFARVQDSVKASLGQRMREIEEKYKYLKSNTTGDQQPSFTEVMNSLREIGGIFVDARRYQVEALNKEGFSQAEYSWVRDRVFEAAGIEAVGRIDLKALAESARENTGLKDLEAPELPKVNVPEKNRALIKPHLGRMDEWIPLAFFGL
jgi:hypothetical protein